MNLKTPLAANLYYPSGDKDALVENMSFNSGVEPSARPWAVSRA